MLQAPVFQNQGIHHISAIHAPPAVIGPCAHSGAKVREVGPQLKTSTARAFHDRYPSLEEPRHPMFRTWPTDVMASEP